MGHEIRLEKYQIRTDLALESLENAKEKSIDYTVKEEKTLKVTDVFVDEEVSKKIGKKVGNYTTIEFEDITDYENRNKVKKVFSQKLKEFMKREKILKDDEGLVIGLGNEKSTPDALGPLTVASILVTKHLFALGSVEEGFRPVTAIAPGVMGTTGIETSDFIQSIVTTTSPKFVLVIDALASQSITRVNKTIQMTDTGIHPGSGIGNQRKEISKEILGIPVIAIGVPTVVDAVTIVSDTIGYMYDHYAFMKQAIKNPMYKLAVGNMNYLKKNVQIDKEDKQNLFGVVGTLNDTETKALIYEVLSPIGYNLMVTPKEVDFSVQKLSEVIADGINMALHKNINKI